MTDLHPKSAGRLKRVTLRAKLVTLFLCLIAIPLSLQGMITYSKFSASTEQRAVEYTGQIVNQINRNLDRNLAEMKRLSLMPLYDNRVISILKELSASQKGSLYPTTEMREKMSLYISSLSYNRPEVRGIQIITNTGMIFSNLDPSAMKATENLKKEAWYGTVLKGNGASVLIPQHKPGYYLERSSERYFSVARLLREPNTNLPIGIIKIDLKLEMIDQILSNMNFTKDGSLIIVNEQNELLFEERNGNRTPGYRTLLRETNWLNEYPNKPIQLHDQRYLVIAHQSNETGVRVISLLPFENLLKDSRELRDFTIVIAAIFLLGAGGLAVFFSYSLSNPLVRLKEKMLQVEKGNFNQRVPVTSHDEIGNLGAQFNRMVGEINRLVNEVYMISLREKEAELAALQSQINPHFIYNTLEAINMMAIRGGNFDVSDMVTSLGKLLRYTVERADCFVTLRQEMESLTSYIRIQQIRLGHRLQVHFEMEEALLEQSVPKLLLQPLVENAIYHGIGDQERGGTIWISAFRNEHEMLFTIKDDGKGLSKDDLVRLRSSVSVPIRHSEAASTQAGMALRNIAHRIALLYGEKSGLFIDGQPDQGAVFTLRIPLGSGGRK